MSNFITNNTKSKQSTLILLILLSTFIVLGTFFISIAISTELNAYINAGGIAAFLLCIISITKPIWNPESKPQYGVRIATVSIALSAIAAVTGLPNFIQSLIPVWLNLPDVIDPYLNYAVLFFAIFAIWLINYFNLDKTAMGIHPNPLDVDLPEPDLKTRLKNVTESLTEDLKTIDKETNWNVQLFTPLDAEVELRTDNGLKKKVTDLLSAIKDDKEERLFLVLGDPGSGKSVALRKLCRDLASEVEKTGKIPVYINLKEWKATREWTAEVPPTYDELNDFVKNNLKNRDIVTARFFEDERYMRLYESGRLYFIFDSFDEIPAVMNEPDRSPLIAALSKVIYKFLKGARSQESQGILASRIFRKPTDDFDAKITLEIRPFSEVKIEKTLRNSLKFNESLLQELFKKRSDLINIARNPFMASLISSYTENNNNHLPDNQSEVFSNYIATTLDACRDKMKARNLSKENVIQGAIRIADFMFEISNLDVPIRVLKARLGGDIDDIIDILKFSRIGRVGTGDDNNFTFSHRRFCEYFVVQKMLQDDKEFDLSTIPNDSQWRDALVLYCEVAPEEKARKIANYCWEYIKQNDDTFQLPTIHCLRFIQDAFKTRMECISDFKNEFSTYILVQINEKHILKTKLAVESLVMLNEEDKTKGFTAAFRLNNDWITEIVFKSLRYYRENNNEIVEKAIEYLDTKSILNIYKNKSEYSFIIQLLDTQFDRLKMLFKLRVFEIWIIPTSICFLISNFLFFNITEFKNISNIVFLLIMCITRIWSNDLYLKTLLFISCWLVLNSNFETFCLFAIILPDIIRIVVIYLKNILNIILNLKYRILFKSVAFIVIIIFVGSYTFDYLRTLPLPIIISIFEYIKKMFLFLLYVILLSGIIYISKGLVKQYRIYKSINYTQLNDRSYIYQMFKELSIPIFRNLFLNYLENNIKEVKGEWPNLDVLQVKDDDEIGYTRLARLEEKWLGLNK